MKISIIVFSLFLLLAGVVFGVPYSSPARVGPAATPDFSIRAFPSNLTITAFSSGLSTINVTSLNGFSGNVTLSTSPTPSGFGVGISPFILKVPASGTAQATVSVDDFFNSTIVFTFNVIGTSSALSHFTTIQVNGEPFIAPSFSINAPNPIIVSQGSKVSSAVVVSSLHNFAGTVSLTSSVFPQLAGGPTSTLTPAQVTVTPGSSAASTLTIATTPTTPIGFYNYTVTGTAPQGGAFLTQAFTGALTVSAPAQPDFAISAIPQDQTVVAGSTATSTILLTSINGFAGTVSLTTPLVPCFTYCWSISPTSVQLSPGGTATSTLTITTLPSITPGNYSISVSALSGSLSHMIVVQFKVIPSSTVPDFTMSARPQNQTVAVGSTGTSTILLTGINGFNGTITLSTSPPPLCASCPGWGISPSKVPLPSGGNASAVLTFSTVLGTPLRAWTVTVTGASGTVTRSVNVGFVVVPSSDFFMSANPSSQKVQAGSSATSMITLTSIGGFSGTVTLTLPVMCLAIGCPTWSISPSSVNLSPGGTATAILTFSSSTTTPPGNYTVQVTGTSGSLSHHVNVLFIVVLPSTSPDFAMAANPTSLIIPAGTTATSTIVLTSLHGFSGTVSLATSPSPLCPAPVCSTWSVNPTVVALSPNGTAVSTLSIYGGTGGGSGNITVFGTSGSLTHSVRVLFTVVTSVPDFIIIPTPGNLTITPGSSGTSTINVTSINAFAGTVVLTATVSPSGPTASLNPSSITLLGGGTANSILTVSTTGSTSPGFYIVAVTGTSASKTHSVQVGVTVTSLAPPDFTITANPVQITVPAGASATSTITVNAINGFSGAVFFSLSSTPGLLANINPHNVTGSGTATLTVSSGTPGNYTSTVTGTSGSISHTVTILVTVTAPPPPPDFTITVTPSSQSVPAGSSTTFTITIRGTNGFNGTVHLTATISPLVRHGPTITLPSTVGPYSDSTLTVSTSHPTPHGTYTITITATSGSLTHTATVTVVVTP